MTVLKQFLPLALSGTDYLYHYLFQTGNSHSYNVWGFWMSVPRTKFANSSAKKAWSKFHAARFEQIPGIAENLKLSSDISYHVSLKILSI